MNEPAILIIGAGASGLLAAYELSQNGYKVIVVEARDRIGGRVFTYYDSSSGTHAEAGAEFVHGDASITMELLKKFNLEYSESEGEMFQSDFGKLKKNDEMLPGWTKIRKSLSDLKADMTVKDFLDKEFSREEDAESYKSILKLVEGYDAADPSKASVFALRDEWFSDKEPKQYRIKNGYSELLQCLVTEIEKKGGEIQLSKVVKELSWKKSEAKVFLENRKYYTGNKALITLPIPVLRDPVRKGSINIKPAINDKIKLLHSLGYGGVIKILFQFKDPFWTQGQAGSHKQVENVGFIFSDEPIPTWWTQLPNKNPLLTGWLAGPATEKYRALPDDKITELAINSLADIFGRTPEFIKQDLLSSKVFNWCTDPYSRGGYSYSIVNEKEIITEFIEAVENTLYFAGEGYYSGKESGTVEAAFKSGKEAAERIIKDLK